LGKKVGLPDQRDKEKLNPQIHLGRERGDCKKKSSVRNKEGGGKLPPIQTPIRMPAEKKNQRKAKAIGYSKARAPRDPKTKKGSGAFVG